MLTVHPMSDASSLLARRSDPGVVFLPSPPELEPNTPLEAQVVAAAIAGGIDEPTELADFAIDVLEADALLPREPWPFSRGEQQVGGLLVALGQPFHELVLVDPSAGLDARKRKALADFLRELGAEGHRITIATNDQLF